MAPDPADFEAPPPCAMANPAQSSRGDIVWGGGSDGGVGRGA